MEPLLKFPIKMYKILKRVYACLFVYTLLLSTCGKQSVKVVRPSRAFLDSKEKASSVVDFFKSGTVVTKVAE
jgi:hypothetical protein